MTLPHRLSWLTMAVLLSAGSVSAQNAPAPLPEPNGEIILTVTGDIAVQNGDGAARFDLAMLEELGSQDITTSTLWTEGVRTFTGVPLVALMERLGVEGGMLKATALNDYEVQIPVSDAVEGGPIVAHSLDGEPMSVRDKGPLWIVYPYDQNLDYQTEVIYSRSIWQLDRLEVGP